MKTRAVILTTLVAAFVVSRAAARQDDQMDVELFMKWATAEVVHYDVVAEYSARTPILTGGSKATVKDRFEVSFDAMPQQAWMTGKPAFKNTASTVSNDVEAICMPPQISGSYEHLDIVDAKPTYQALKLTIKRTFPLANVSGRSDTTGACGYSPAPGRVDTLEFAIPVIPGTGFASPAAAPTHVVIGEPGGSKNTVIIGKDQKTIVVDASADGWKYTYTVRIVK